MLGAAVLIGAVASPAEAQWTVINLNPAGASLSLAYGVDGGQQVGIAVVGGIYRASLWSGTAASWVDLSPAGATDSQATGVDGGQQVGFARMGGIYRASLWSGTAASWVDLSAFLPPGFTNSQAWSIWHDAGVTYVIGYGINSTLNRYEALMWVWRVNRPPVANAGADRSVGCTSTSGTQVTLDGSGSSDPDGDTLTFTWTGPFGTAVGMSPAVTLPLGSSTITLTVSDGSLSSPPDTVAVAVTVGVQGLQTPLAALVVTGSLPPLPNRAFRLGSTLPLKLQLVCGTTALTNLDVAPPEIVSLVREGEAIPLETIDLDAGQANDSGRLFRYADGNWVFNLSTKGVVAGTYEIVIRMPDGRRFSAGFVLR